MREKILEVLEAFKILLNDSMALDYCGITGKDRKIILNDPYFIKETRRIKAEKYIEEIKEINNLLTALNYAEFNENKRFSEFDEDTSKIINLKMKVTAMRRELLSLTASDKESDESDGMNIFFIDVTREEFEKMVNVEVHEGYSENTNFTEEEETTVEKIAKIKKKENIPLAKPQKTITYINSNGEKIIEEVLD
ncbi:MAG: hypothetical protein KBG49_14120 [Spirochaetes bacterium]|nr:hypothetical protein [Spirochaetota bacterium]